jgi:elongation factor P--beta-lysine ligase
MDVNPNVHHMVAKERAKDLMREAEAWRQYQAIRHHDESRPEASGVALGLKRLVRRLSAAAGDEASRQRGSTVSSPAR